MDLRGSGEMDISGCVLSERRRAPKMVDPFAAEHPCTFGVVHLHVVGVRVPDVQHHTLGGCKDPTRTTDDGIALLRDTM